MSTVTRSIMKSERVMGRGDYAAVAAYFSDSIFEMLQIVADAVEREVMFTDARRSRLVTIVVSVEAEEVVP